MKPTSKKVEDVGIIIARMQVHKLHQAHRNLIDKVVSKHDKVFIFIGLSPLRNTTRNPLDFNTRKRMIQEDYPEIDVYYIDDNRSNETWSKNLDREIKRWLKPYQTAKLYGSRDSFIDSYSGTFPVEELESEIFISGTEIRRQIANNYTLTEEFRAGMIAGTFNRYPTCFPAVDVAIIDYDHARILMGRKSGEEKFRFVGGFADPTSPSFEADARREVMEETKLAIDVLEYVGSTLVDDWRYRKENDKIKTLLYIGHYTSGRPEASDDLAEVKWFNLDELKKDELVEEHGVLYDMIFLPNIPTETTESI